MRLLGYTPAKNGVLIEEVKVAKAGNIILKEDTGAGYYKVVAVGPLCKGTTKVGDYVLIGGVGLDQGVEITFDKTTKLQIPEHTINGYYVPTKEELITPTPVFKAMPVEEEDELNIIDSDSDGGNNALGSEPKFRD